MQLLNAVRVAEEVTSDLVEQKSQHHSEATASPTSERPHSPSVATELGPKSNVVERNHINLGNRGQFHGDWTYIDSLDRDTTRLIEARLILRGAKATSESSLQPVQLRSQQLVYQLAQEIIREQTETTTSWSWDADNDATPIMERPRSAAKMAAHETFADIEHAAGPSRPIMLMSSYPMREEMIVDPVTKEETGHLLEDIEDEKNEPEKFEPEIIQSDDSEDESPQLHVFEAESDFAQSEVCLSDIPELEELLDLPLSSSSLGKKPEAPEAPGSQDDSEKPKTQFLEFEDAVGRKFRFPWSMVKKWKVCKLLLK